MFRRRQYLIDKKYQLRFVLGGVVYIAAITVCLTLPFMPLISSMNALLVDVPSDVANMVQRQQNWVIVTFVLCAVWLMAAWVIFAILRSHKIAGPVYNIVNFMKRVAGGDLKARVVLRTGDDLQAIAKGLNEMLESLQAREETAKQRPGSTHDRGQRAIAFIFRDSESTEKTDAPKQPSDTELQTQEVPS
jgi:methyl-accepting chemotaxis protein